MTKTQPQGFTMIELMLVIVILGILSAVVYTSLNFRQQMGGARNTTRRIDIYTISSGVKAYIADTGEYPPAITDTPTEICRTDAVDCNGLVDLSMVTNNSKYMIKIPIDKQSEGNSTGYRIHVTPNGQIIVSAPLAENGDVLTVVR